VRRGGDDALNGHFAQQSDLPQGRRERRKMAAGLDLRGPFPGLGLGNVAIKAKELRHYTGKGGRLDILAYNSALDTYYEIEIMLGECDADHGFRVLDYWARERIA
jgi:hypothetical protein